MAIAGSVRSRRISRSTRRIGERAMNFSAVFFYLFSAVMLGSAFMVIASRNPVHSVLFLILTFVNAAGLFVLAGAEFLALILIVVYVGAWVAGPGIANAVKAPIPPVAQVTNTQAIGRVLYTTYVHYFELAGIVLLVAMIGAIVLTLQHRKNVQRQNISAQNARSKKTALEIRKVRPGQGI